MAETITRYKVFIASPSGLEAERQAFRETIRDYNAVLDELDRGVSFMPVGWEDTLGGVGRPQALINEDIIACDYFILLLYDRWGSPPDVAGTGPYSSACEEEFHLALQCLEAEDKPMSEIVIFFKAVPQGQLADPGTQLQKVMEFRRMIEHERQHHFTPFNKVEAFRQRLRIHLAEWVKRHEAGIGDMNV